MAFNASEIFFREDMSGKFTPRSIFLDSDESVLNKIKSGSMSELYSTEQFFDSGRHQYISGHVVRFTSEQKECVYEAMRKEIEMCDGFQGFFFNYAVGGGTATSFLEAIYDSIEYKKQSFGLSIWPSQKDKLSSVIEPYNAAFNITSQL